MDELLSESALMAEAGGSPGVTKWTIGVLVEVAVFSKVAVGWITATVAAGGCVAVLIAAVVAALVGALLGVTPGVALVKLHARMEVNKTAILNQVVIG
ncbi:MAG: hypothetical protein ABSA23_03765 [Anaerolineales bacterium]